MLENDLCYIDRPLPFDPVGSVEIVMDMSLEHIGAHLSEGKRETNFTSRLPLCSPLGDEDGGGMESPGPYLVSTG